MFIGGLVVGAIITYVVIGYAIGRQPKDQEVTVFDSPGEIKEEVMGLKVFQVLDDHAALAAGLPFGAVYLLRNHDGKYYTDDEIITVPDGKVVRQMGIYKYKTEKGDYKTVSIIEIMDH